MENEQRAESELHFHPPEYEGRTHEVRATIVLRKLAVGVPVNDIKDQIEEAVSGNKFTSWRVQMVLRDGGLTIMLQYREHSSFNAPVYREICRKVTAAYDQLVLAYL